jgi:hypothetical protein
MVHGVWKRAEKRRGVRILSKSTDVEEASVSDNGFKDAPVGAIQDSVRRFVGSRHKPLLYFLRMLF